MDVRRQCDPHDQVAVSRLGTVQQVATNRIFCSTGSMVYHGDFGFAALFKHQSAVIDVFHPGNPGMEPVTMRADGTDPRQ
ncbi:MAG: hypothetical protein JSS66_05360 [Armatimonadetes bacterium]|nr:hypothetical protein [Armatimonadota bacterium]